MGDIVVAWGNARVLGVKEFQKQVAATAPGTQVRLEVLRDGRRVLATVKLEEAEGKTVSRLPPRRDPVDTLGMTVSPVHPRLLRELELRGGVEVTFVETASPAWEGGIREGDILLAINREVVHNVEAYRKAISRVARGDVVPALVSREGGLLYVALRNK